ncbi:hypothetical protein B0H63DRAFT_391881 [Podospora didyma]|uniref:FAD-binding PCMH-type domain-containing protein n=1 Tax=Podospora didyma TaxID=330526 RepID=A0AAE0NSA1_9PEZI|nr:hypothetical protein B0H63DRAFT_391881 [Podospora didyma]
MEALLANQLAREKKKSRNKNWLIAGITVVAIGAHYFNRPEAASLQVLQQATESTPLSKVSVPKQQAAPTVAPTVSLQDCLNAVCAGRDDCVHYDGHGSFKYFFEWLRPLNLAYLFTPAAVVRPRTAAEVSAVVKCAAQAGVKVQAKSGGHSYGNYGLGGQDGSVSVDLVNFQDVWVNTTGNSWQAHIGAGGKLGDIDEKLVPFKRAFAHGVCPGVGIGGHATIGGLGPMSRMWGSCLDHVEEVEVVVADGRILRANNRENADLFWALKGAGASFGIITKFVMKTHPEPQEVVDYVYNFQYSHMEQMVDFFVAWQKLVADPNLDRRLGTEFMLHPLGARVSATWYGTRDEFRKTGIPNRLPSGNDSFAINENSWIGHLYKAAQKEALKLSDIPNHFYSRSLGFTRNDLLSKASVMELFKWVDEAPKGTLAWFIIFDASGGIISDLPNNATAYAHRDKIHFYQSYGLNILHMSSKTKAFLDNFHQNLLNFLPARDPHGTYPGYVDPYLKNAQEEYWMGNLPTLEAVKSKWDPQDTFHNPQSVRPKTSAKLEFANENLNDQ